MVLLHNGPQGPARAGGDFSSEVPRGHLASRPPWALEPSPAVELQVEIPLEDLVHDLDLLVEEEDLGDVLGA